MTNNLLAGAVAVSAGLLGDWISKVTAGGHCRRGRGGSLVEGSGPT